MGSISLPWRMLTVAKPGRKERRFIEALRDLFVGAKVDGESGYINLMRIKSSYFTGLVEPELMRDIDAALEDFPDFREEMFDKLHAFFSRYFSRSGSICFAYTPNHFNVYEKVYTDEKDVVLFWKTHMLYYVKTDTLFQDIKVEMGGETFFFDCAKLQHKKANEKRQTVHTFVKVEKDGAIRIAVTYSENGRKTKTEDILKALKKAGHPVKETALEKAIRVFERQSEVDYFINKDAGGFLREQFDLWMYQYMFRDEHHWTEGRVRRLQAIKNIAFKIIDFIARFEDELVRVWNKPKFVRGSHYVVTLDRLASKEGGLNAIAALIKHKGMKEQVAEWVDLGIDKKGFDPKVILNGAGKKQTLAEEWQFLPADTKHFTSLELKLLELFDNLDEELDGRLIKSENYQALNTLREKYSERIDGIYIDPPYNTGTEASEFVYANSYQHASWLTFIENRISVAKEIAKKSAITCITIDDYEYRKLLELVDTIKSAEILGTVVVRNKPQGRPTASGFSVNHEYAVFLGTKGVSKVGRLPREGSKAERYPEMDEIGSYAWANLRKTGSGSERGDREKQYYPIYVSGTTLRIPTMDWDEQTRLWINIEKPRKGEEVLYPIDDEGKERVWNLSPQRVEDDINDLTVIRTKNGTQIQRKYRPNTEGALPGTWWENRLYSASESGTKVLQDILGDNLDFAYPKSVYAVQDCLRAANIGANKEAIVLDFFAGSGTTAHAVHMLNQLDKGRRKFILIEIGDHFDTSLIPRLKKIAFCEEWKNAEPVKNMRGYSGFYKCYGIEQYEDALATAHYSGDEGDLFRNTKKDPYTQYVFLSDEKQSRVLELDYENNEVNVDLTQLYPDIDLAETLSCVTGKWIKRITEDYVEFADGSRESLVKPDWRLLKPLVFWGAAE